MRQAEGKSVRVAYMWSIAGLLVPAWIGGATTPDTASLEWTPRWIATLAVYYVAIAWGTSAGYFYSGKTRYGIAAGLGKSVVLAVGIVAQAAVGRDGGHPYVVALAVMVVATWDLGDLVYLYRAVRRRPRRG